MVRNEDKRSQIGICMGWLVLAWAMPAQAEETSLNWVRLDGAEECISAPTLAKLVEARFGRRVLQPPSTAELSIEGRVAPNAGGGWLAILAANDRLGHRVGQRELRVAEGPCSALDQPASLAISLMIDPSAEGPRPMDQGQLSADAQRLLAQIELPNGNPDEVLASHHAPSHRAGANALHPLGAAATSRESQASAPPVKMISVPEAEWRHLRAQTERSDATTPAWPGHVLLGVGALGAGGFVYSFLRMRDINADERFLEYRGAAIGSQSGDVCVDARRGLTYGLSKDVPAHVSTLCSEGTTLSALTWVFLGTAVLGSAVGAAWLLWIADDEAPVSVTPAASPAFTGAQLRIRI